MPVTGTARSSRKRKPRGDSLGPPQKKHRRIQTADVVDLSVKKSLQNEKAPTLRTTVNSIPLIRLEVFVVGDGSGGELGLGSNTLELTKPRLNPNLSGKVVDIATGGMHAAAITGDSKVLTWGVNDNYALGRDTAWEGGMRDIDEDDGSSEGELNPKESTPTAISLGDIPAGSRIVQVAAGDSATFVLTAEGTVYGWGTFVTTEGKRFFGLDSENRAITIRKEPMLIPHLERITRLSAGINFCLALDADGTVFSWGTNESNQLGRRVVIDRRAFSRLSQEFGHDLDKVRTVVGLRPHPVGLSKRTKIVSIHTGTDHAFAIDTKGNTWAWGLNNFGQTAIPEGAGNSGSTISAPRKVLCLAGKGLRMIAGGAYHSVCVTRTGECLVWGRVDGGTSGLDINKLSLEYAERFIFERGKARILTYPTSLPIPSCVHVAAGTDHTIAITHEGKAYAWGYNIDNRCGPGPDEIPVPTVVSASSINNKRLIWAGAGGHYSIFASQSEDHSSAAGPLINGISTSESPQT
ncbi:hypothetical protein PRK78_002661 [Emydomyces testavorans]|uniref:RCC1-like domain-containing protein n=1 Tax=Emydomyces testavorans TaxID=2070801 RepID=A0AAF0DFJ3_9EURO|nr:hypothetical protein PRK78_002661 [Emydomyces testavorans]